MREDGGALGTAGRDITKWYMGGGESFIELQEDDDPIWEAV